jgi:FAD/FMN-containing dehydrogenase/Fe-S oxidoreductase
METRKLRSFDQLLQSFTGQFLDDPLVRGAYANDASVYQEVPLAVAFPMCDDDVKALILFAHQTGVGLIPRTAGTSLAGQVVGRGIVVDVSRHLTNIVEINAQEKWVRVQPGVIRDELNLALKPFGLLFGPETSTSNRAMIGGMLGNNSCGSNSIVYGTTRDQTLEVAGFLSDGTHVRFGPLNQQEFATILNRRDDSGVLLETEIYRGTSALLADPANLAEIAREFPKPTIHRRNTGYALDALADCQVFGQSSAPFNFCKLIAGSEGTLFFATEIKLRLHALPPPVNGLLCAHFATIADALRATQVAMRFQPYACELIDHFILAGAARNLEQKRNIQFVEGAPEAILAVEFRDESRDAVAEASNSLKLALQEEGLGYAWPLLLGEETKQAWDLRKAGIGVINNVPGDAKPTTVVEDTAVALEDLPEYIREFNELLKSKYDVECVHYGHAGAGEIHLRPVLNLKTDVGQQKFHAIAADVATLVKKYRGSLSGEHGDGRLRGEFLETMVGSRNYHVMRKVKQLWDPKGIFNPGKIVDTPPMSSNLRYHPQQTNPQPDTVFDFGSTQGMLGAAELCSGSGDCRKTHLSGGTMCPSYMATRNETDTTRARANLLRQAMTGSSEADQDLSERDVFQILDLCLSCKGCKNECPSNVDMAKLKAEFLNRYYEKQGTPRRARLIANVHRYNRLGSVMPQLANWLAGNSMTGSWLKRWAGFSEKRTLPRLSKQTLRSWFKRHAPHANAGARGEVNLFCDEFTNYFDAPIGIAAIELLERLGWKVCLPRHTESGRAAISKGLLRRARGIAEQNVTALASVTSSARPLVGIEPSALLTFRDEYPDLLRGTLQNDAKKLAENSLLIDELLDRADLGSQPFASTPKTIRLHGHCHQKALSSLASTVRILQLPVNYSVRLIPSGCCGMAGSFGFEKEHYEISMQIGELVLFPTVRNEPAENLIAATGTSCRQQIFDGTGRRAWHPVEILRDALLD